MEAKTLLGQTLINIADGTCKEYVIFASTEVGIDVMAEIAGEHKMSFLVALGKIYYQLKESIAAEKEETLQ